MTDTKQRELAHTEILEGGKTIYETKNNRESGTHTGVIDLREFLSKRYAVPAKELAAKYAVVCFTHGITLQMGKRLEAEELSHHPVQYCTECAKAGTSRRRATGTPAAPADKWEASREVLRGAYMFVLNNWAVERGEVTNHLYKINLLPKDGGVAADARRTREVLDMLESAGLLASTHVNGANELTYQTYYDVENDDQAIRKGRRAFNKAYPATQ
jgi:hypothetical protein